MIMEETVEKEAEEEEVACSICMEKAEIAMTYQCCKQISCRKCYTTMHRQHRRKDCPFCRHTPVRALTSPLRAGITKSKILLSSRALEPLFTEILSKHGEKLKMGKGARNALRQAMEEYCVDRMRVANAIVRANGKATVRNL
jgi:histone H3/H4